MVHLIVRAKYHVTGNFVERIPFLEIQQEQRGGVGVGIGIASVTSKRPIIMISLGYTPSGGRFLVWTPNTTSTRITQHETYKNRSLSLAGFAWSREI